MHISFASIKNYKTYIVAATTIMYAGVEFWDGSLSSAAALSLILGALGLSALRHDPTKTEK